MTREHGDRAAFLGRIRSRQGPPATVGPHPAPPPPAIVPEVRYRRLDGVDPADPEALLPLFVAAATRAAAVVHVVDRAEPAGAVAGTVSSNISSIVASIVGDHGVQRAVVSGEAEAQALRPHLEALGLEVADYLPGTGVGADLGVTSAIAAVAATGSVVVDAAAAGGRGASLLPTVHLCVVPRARLVATPSDVLRRGAMPLPSNRVLVTGPSRTGDIEQIITLGVHGPTAVHVLLV